jgi:hypothetical protein
MSATGIRNPPVMIVPNLAKSEHRKLGLLRYLPAKHSRAVRLSVLVLDSESVSELSDFRKTWSVSRVSLRPILGISLLFLTRYSVAFRINKKIHRTIFTSMIQAVYSLIGIAAISVTIILKRGKNYIPLSSWFKSPELRLVRTVPTGSEPRTSR